MYVCMYVSLTYGGLAQVALFVIKLFEKVCNVLGRDVTEAVVCRAFTEQLAKSDGMCVVCLLNGACAAGSTMCVNGCGCIYVCMHLYYAWMDGNEDVRICMYVCVYAWMNVGMDEWTY